MFFYTLFKNIIDNISNPTFNYKISCVHFLLNLNSIVISEGGTHWFDPFPIHKSPTVKLDGDSRISETVIEIYLSIGALVPYMNRFFQTICSDSLQ